MVYQICFGILAISLLFFFEYPREQIQTISINDEVLEVVVVSTPHDRAQGLSGRTSLAPHDGMLFTYEKPGTNLFWMKDMLFSIDILWFDENRRLVFIEEGLSPETFPGTFGPRHTLTQFVLEVPAGFVAEAKIKIGDEIKFEK